MSVIFRSVVLSFLFLSLSIQALDFPTSPDHQLTPGTLCAQKKEKRYPEGIFYCKRDVSKGTKDQVISKYDSKLGYRVGDMERGDFKIDHYIPLCAGGSNEASNLWPQHKTVYELTDPLEGEVCVHMQMGLLKQSEVIEIMRDAKADPERAPEVFQRLQKVRLH